MLYDRLRLTAMETPDGGDTGAGGGEGADFGAGGGERPDWLLDRFETPEAQAQAYAEAQAELGRTKAEMQRQQDAFAQSLDSIAQQQPTFQQGQQGYDPATAAIQQALDTGDAAALTAALGQTLAPALGEVMRTELGKITSETGQAQQDQRMLAFNLAEERVKAEIGAEKYAEIAPKLSQRFQEVPGLLPQGADVNSLYSVLRTEAGNIENAQIAAAAQQSEAARQAKLSAQTAEASAAQKFPTDTSEKKKAWDDVKNASGVATDIFR